MTTDPTTAALGAHAEREKHDATKPAQRKRGAVHYCPGAAPGSPAWLTAEQADCQLVQDDRYVRTMKGVGTLDKNAPQPHIGGVCSACSTPYGRTP